ncbi:hypothetical protein L1987_84571 [Smallanthus sonchifolius]|uniref:Uncharacterized protein n=1 Tax=Smallanthus sonchifolius TaxID=185202 RepID=A0ACB8YFQ2_9ASTR|nr:hypothetical protein L1987_84571 [Smallanthus sonchifolius]
MEQVEGNQPLDTPPSQGPVTDSVGSKINPAVHRPTGPKVDEDGFTTITRRKKLGPIKVQSRNQKPVKIKAAPQQKNHVRTFGKHAPAGQIFSQEGKSSHANQAANNLGVVMPPLVASIASKKGSTGFNFARAVQGDRGVNIHQQPSTKMDPQPTSLDIDTTNRFSVLDIPNSIKLNKLIEVQDDLYPPDQSLEDGMEVDMTQAKDGQIMVDKPSQINCEDQVLTPCPLPVCQVNREFREGVPILPSSIATPPKDAQQPMGQRVTTAQSVREEKEEKDYGITKAQKMAITGRLCGPAQAVRAVDMDNWEQGEHKFFEDQVKGLGLDYNYCIEDVESDDENGTAQFFTARMKGGINFSVGIKFCGSRMVFWPLFGNWWTAGKGEKKLTGTWAENMRYGYRDINLDRNNRPNRVMELGVGFEEDEDDEIGHWVLSLRVDVQGMGSCIGLGLRWYIGPDRMVEGREDAWIDLLRVHGSSGGNDLLVNKVVTAGDPIVEANGCSISGEGAPGGDPRESVSSLPDPLTESENQFRQSENQFRQSVPPVAVQIGQMEVDIPSGAAAKPVPSSHHGPSQPKSPAVVVLDNPKTIKGGNPPVVVPTGPSAKGGNHPVIVLDEDGFTTVNRKEGFHLKGAVSNQVGGQNSSNLASSGFNFARAINGANAKPNKLPNPVTVTNSQPPRSLSRAASRNPLNSGSSMEVDPPPICSSNRFAALNEVLEQNLSDQSFGTGTNFAELDLHAIANCVPETEKVVCNLNREHSEGARLLPASILSSPSPGGTLTNGGGRSYGISDSQRKAIADRLSVSNSICSEETVNWCPGEWDYFNDLCISLGLDPDYCIEDVESDTENGTAQFLSDAEFGAPEIQPIFLRLNCKLVNRSEKIDNGLIGAVHVSLVWSLHYYLGCTILSVWVMGQLESILTLLGSWPVMALKHIWVLFWHVRFVVTAHKESPRWAIWSFLEAAHEGGFLGKPVAFFSAHSDGPMHGYFDNKCLNCNGVVWDSDVTPQACPFILMDPVDKETHDDDLRGVEPPEPGAEGRFWSSDMSDDETHEEDAGINKPFDRSADSRSRKGRKKPSSLLDGSKEGALRRYGLRNSDGIHKSTLQSLPNRKKSSSRKKETVRNINCNSMGKENVATELNCTNNMSINVEPCMGTGSLLLSTNPITDDCMLIDKPVEHHHHTTNEGPSLVEGHDESCDAHVTNTTPVQIVGPVQTNMVYAGDSILNSLSNFDSHCNNRAGMEGDDQEVNSDTSNKSNSVLENGEAGKCNFSCQQDLNTTFDHNSDRGMLSEWEALMLSPIRIDSHEPWSTTNDLDLHNLKWIEVLRTAINSWKDLDDEPRVMILERTGIIGEDCLTSEAINFFEENHNMVECLAKWWENQKLQDHGVRRKVSSSNGKQSVWLDKFGTEGKKEDGSHWRIMKKHKGEKHISKYNTHEEVPNQRDPASKSEDLNGRKKHKIWSSKNRKPEKNMPTSKVHFQQSFNGADISNQSLGCYTFNMGSDKLQLVEMDSTSHTPKGRPRCLLYNQIAAKQAKLVEIAARINTTSENSLLLSSIRGISFRNIKQFLAKINETGEVNIDANMVEEEPILVNENENLVGPDPVSYASMMAGKRITPQDDKIQFYPPLVTNEGSPGGRNEPVIVNVSSRNVVNKTRQQVIPEKSTEEVMLESPVVITHTETNMETGPHLKENLGVKDSGHTHKTIHKKPMVSLLETKNRFALLDEEGNELGDMQGERTDDNNLGEIPKELHEGWIRKQERVLNARYYKDLTQDQRFEAKQYILDRLIPLDSTLSSWPKLLVEYFRHLSSLYNFGDGYLAAVRFRTYGSATEEDNGSHTDSHMEDVESETDGTAVFMKSDGPATNSHATFPTSINSPEVDIRTSHASDREGNMQKTV